MDNNRLEPFGLVLGSKTLVSTIHSCHYFIPTDDVLMLPNLVIYRNWEAELSDFVKRNLQVETTFIDIGSNFGYFAVLAKQCRGAAEFSNVIAFEPNPKMFDLLQENMRINWGGGKYELINKAVSNIAGTATLASPKSRSGNASLYEQPLSGSEEYDSYEVEVLSIDEYFNHTPKDAFVKIDVEGHELNVLEGMRRTISGCKKMTIAMEWSPQQLGKENQQGIIKLITEVGLDIEFMNGETIKPHELNDLSYNTIILRKKLILD